MGRRRQLPRTPFSAVVESLDAGGYGRIRQDGRELKVFGALPEETISARYRFGRQFRGHAEVEEVTAAGRSRVEPRCPLFGVCGVCTLQHMDHAAQLEFKQDQLQSLLAGEGVEPGVYLQPLTAGLWNYRRKARLSVRWVEAKGRVLVGYREQDKRFVTDMRECHTLDQRIARQLGPLSGLLGSMDARGSIPQIEAACGDDQCVLVFRHLDGLSAADLRRLADFAANSGISVWLQPKGPTTVHPLGGHVDSAGACLHYDIPSASVRISFAPLDFIQVNSDLNRLMVPQALKLLEVGPGHRVLDLFCGLGNFTLPLARRAQRVLGIEGGAELVQRARDNADANGLTNVDFEHVDLYAQESQSTRTCGDFDRVLLDPPRSGAAGVLPLIAASGARRVVYVSCNPVTLARDARALVRTHGFHLAAAGIMDMFPQTAHIETMALFERRSA